MRGATAKRATTGRAFAVVAALCLPSSPVVAQRQAPRSQPRRAPRRSRPLSGPPPPSPCAYHLDPWLQRSHGRGDGAARDNNAERSLPSRRHRAGRQPRQAGPGPYPVVRTAFPFGQGSARPELQRRSGRQVQGSLSGRRPRQSGSHGSVRGGLRFAAPTPCRCSLPAFVTTLDVRVVGMKSRTGA